MTPQPVVSGSLRELVMLYELEECPSCLPSISATLTKRPSAHVRRTGCHALAFTVKQTFPTSPLTEIHDHRSCFKKKKPYDNLVITRIKDSDVPDDLDQHQSADRAKRSTLFACCRLTHGKAQQVHLDALRWLQLGV